MKVLVTIDKNILKRTKHCGSSPTKCAITEAVKGLFPDCYTMNGHIVTGLGYNTGIKLPFEAFKWYQAWDKMTPPMRVTLPEFSFEIEVPERIISKIGYDTFTKRIERSPDLKLIDP